MPDMVRKFRKELAALGSQERSLEDKVEILHELCHLAGFGNQMEAFVTAQGIRVLAHISTAEWPEDGDLRNSTSIYDKDAQLVEGRIEEQSMLRDVSVVSPCSPQTHHTMRRVAIGCLGEMCNYPLYIQALIAENFYAHLPRMLRDTGKVYKYGQSYDEMYGVAAGSKTDHAQFILERLVNIMAGTFANMGRNRPIFDQLTEKCVPEVTSRVDIFQYERRSSSGMSMGLQQDPFIETYTRCVYNMLGVSAILPLTRAAQVALVRADIIGRLNNLPPSSMAMGMRGMAHAQLQKQYEKVMEELHIPSLCAEMQKMRQASLALCEQASAHFAASDFKAALEAYRGALAVCPWSSEGAAGVAAALLASRKPKKALDAAFLAVQHNPRWAAGWVRLAEVMLALGDPQKARRCIEVSRKLAPLTPDSFDMDALLEATPAPSDGHTNTAEINATVHSLSMLALALERAPSMPLVMREWTVSAATFGHTGSVAKAPIYIMSLMGGEGDMVDQEVCECLPSPELIQCVLLRAMAFQRSSRPKSILVAYRFAYAWPVLKALQHQLGGGMELVLETKYDALLSATRNSTDYCGFNGEDSGRKEYTKLMVTDL